MRQPNTPDDEIVAVATSLHAEGRLSVRRLKEAVGVAERGRLLRACREVRKSVKSELPAPPAAPDKDAEEMPENLRIHFNRLDAAVLAELRTVRAAELDRARLAETAHAARHEEQLGAAEARGIMLAEDLDEAEEEISRLEEEVGRLGEEIGRLEEDLASQRTIAERERSGREAVERRRNEEAESHLKERFALNEALTAATAKAAANAEGRSRAEAAAAAAQATAAAAEAELARARTERTELRTRNEELISQLAAAEAHLKQARRRGFTAAAGGERVRRIRVLAPELGALWQSGYGRWHDR